MTAEATSVANVTRPSFLFVPSLVAAAVVAALAGSFVGRTCVIACERAEGTCRVESRGFLYPIQDETVAIADISGVGVETTTSTSVRAAGSRAPAITTTHHDVLLRIRPTDGSVRPDVRVHTYDPLGGGEATGLAARRLSDFLESKLEPRVVVEFGTHRTAFAATALLLVVLGLLASCRYLWTAKLEVHREDHRERIRSRIRVVLEMGPGLTKRSDWVTLEGNAASRAAEDYERRLPPGLPSSLRARILGLIELERQDVARRVERHAHRHAR
jgi:hypothetical protein